ncbi:hypothetical protein DFJ58DRAFT_760927 [Suillus subalutaceus]|uniref:uncharacterized protein n=1 Tax=Suillus subalutaceus TaxID=48586 RepID=UPI001B86CB0B|nr:uncharacterized protein DFJ58DRAFT_760927 [Suillus subalutaceus]KAG1873064.1 hypothetical protein DFJ58DRAFT_760927 [Suillus subalutaceus]
MPPNQSPLNFFTSTSAYSRLSWPHYDLGFASGIAIFFGGEAAVSTLALQPLYGRTGIWHGWYNTPGCHTIAWEMVRTLLRGPFSSYSERLTLSLGLDGKKGPKYIASHSGTVMQHTRHLAYVLDKSDCRSMGCEPVDVGQRHSPTPMQLIIMDFKNTVLTGDDTLPPRSSRYSSLPIIASIASIGACATCAHVEDWSSFVMILLGMISSGITSFIMSTGSVTLERLQPADGVPPGDGMLLSDNRIVILRGNEEDVNAVTKGKLRLKIKGGGYTLLFCASIALLQVTLQLIYMPSGSPTGQLMFLLSLLVSGGCNLYLSAKEDDVQSSALITLLNTPEVKTYQTNSRTTAAVLACLALCWKSSMPATQVLQQIVPIGPRPWEALSEILVENITSRSEGFRYWLRNDLSDQEKQLLTELIGDAHAAYDQYIQDYGGR